MLMFFHETNPDKETYWRSIILFGSNVASYKFALAKSLIDLGSNTNDLIKLEDLSIPYTTHLCEHLKKGFSFDLNKLLFHPQTKNCCHLKW